MANIWYFWKIWVPSIFDLGLIYRWGRGAKFKNDLKQYVFYTICEKIKKKFFFTFFDFFWLFWLFRVKIWLFRGNRTFYQHFCNKMDQKKKKKKIGFFFTFFDFFDFLGVNVTFLEMRWLFGSLIATPKPYTTQAELIATTQPNPSQAPTQNLPEPPTAPGTWYGTSQIPLLVSTSTSTILTTYTFLLSTI